MPRGSPYLGPLESAVVGQWSCKSGQCQLRLSRRIQQAVAPFRCSHSLKQVKLVGLQPGMDANFKLLG